MNKNEIAIKLDASVAEVIGNKNLQGFEKAYKVATAIETLSELLNDEYMKPIMKLQGQVLGFRTDRAYDQNVVKSCIIDAVLYGLQPVGNQFNIISGNMYPTKEGLSYLLKNTDGLSFKVVAGLPDIQGETGKVKMGVEWTIDGKQNQQELEFAIRVNRGMGSDAVIGKATRKTYMWLYNTINNTELTDGDVSDLPNTKVIKITPELTEAMEEMQTKLSAIDNVEDLKDFWQVMDAEERSKYKQLFNQRKTQLDG